MKPEKCTKALKGTLCYKNKTFQWLSFGLFALLFFPQYGLEAVRGDRGNGLSSNQSSDSNNSGKKKLKALLDKVRSSQSAFNGLQSSNPRSGQGSGRVSSFAPLQLAPGILDRLKQKWPRWRRIRKKAILKGGADRSSASRSFRARAASR